MEKKALLNTKEVADYLNINEKMVYSLISDKGLPATKVTGKWLFPKHLVDRWIEANTINYPEMERLLPEYHGLIIISGSNDILLDKTISLFNNTFKEHLVVFGNTGSMGGIRAIKYNLCHMASSHLLQEDGQDYNFAFAKEELEQIPAVINFSKREQGLIIQKGNPKNIKGVEDLPRDDVKIVNRQMGTGTRLLLERKLADSRINPDQIQGYRREVYSHLEVGLEVLSGRADAGPGIRAVAGLLGLEFITWSWERFDLLIPKDRFFERGIQLFLGMLHDEPFKLLAKQLEGYDISMSGRMIYPSVYPSGTSLNN